MTTVRVCTLSSLPLNVIRPFTLGFSFEIVLLNTGERVYCFERFCPHANFPLDVKGLFDGTFITCIAHNLKFCVDTGNIQSVKPRCQNLRKFKVEVFGDEVYVHAPNDYNQEN